MFIINSKIVNKKLYLHYESGSGTEIPVDKCGELISSLGF